MTQALDKPDGQWLSDLSQSYEFGIPPGAEEAILERLADRAAIPLVVSVFIYRHIHTKAIECSYVEASTSLLDRADYQLLAVVEPLSWIRNMWDAVHECGTARLGCA